MEEESCGGFGASARRCSGDEVRQVWIWRWYVAEAWRRSHRYDDEGCRARSDGGEALVKTTSDSGDAAAIKTDWRHCRRRRWMLMKAAALAEDVDGVGRSQRGQRWGQKVHGMVATAGG